jgi:anti-anti-sigma regulatory factor
MTRIQASVAQETAQLVVSGPVIRGEGAMWAIQRAIVRCTGSSFRTLVINLSGVDAIDDDGARALKIALHAAHVLEVDFRLESVPNHLVPVLVRNGLATSPGEVPER